MRQRQQKFLIFILMMTAMLVSPIRIAFAQVNDALSLDGISISPEDMQKVWGSLDAVSDPNIREMLRLKLEGKTVADIAAQMGVSEEEVGRSLMTGAMILKNVINVQGGAQPTEELTSETISDNYSAGPEGNAKVVAHGNTKSRLLDVLDLKNMDILDVLKLISQKTGLNIVASQNVKGRITVYLKNIDVLEALKIIVNSYAWAYGKEGETVMVMTDKEFQDKYGYKFGEDFETRIKKLIYASATDALAILNQVKSNSGKIIAEEKSNTLILMDTVVKLDEMENILKQIDVATQTQVFNLSYAKAEDISTKITEILTPNIGKMKFDERSNRVVVSDTPRKIEEIKKFVDAFDQQHKEVLIEAKIIQITLDDTHKMGVNWETVVANYHNLDLTSNFDILSTTDKRGKITVGTIADDRYIATIEALDTVGTTDILSSPRITTVNNKEAKILVGSTEPYVTTTTTTPATGPTTTAESVNFIEVGVKLFVTPTIHNDDYITMKIRPEVSSVVRSLTTSNNNSIPIVETSQAETTVMVKDGATIVIGGLMKESKTKSVKKVPLLGDIPWLGGAFKSTNDSVQKTEIVIFLSPRIVTGDIQGNTPVTTSLAK